MPQDPFPDPDDGEEPDGSLPPEDEDGPGQQGLFLCLPAEEFDPDRFAQCGPASDLPPGALLATLMDLIGGQGGGSGQGGSGLAGLSDNQLVGFVAAARRMESWVTWHSMAAVQEFGRRAKARGPRGEFAADELAAVPARARRADLAHAQRPQLYDDTYQVPCLTTRSGGGVIG